MSSSSGNIRQRRGRTVVDYGSEKGLYLQSEAKGKIIGDYGRGIDNEKPHTR
jgi:hypothetical protein